MSTILRRVAVLLLCVPAVALGNPDHHEFEATLHAPYQGAKGEAREFLLQFAYYGEARVRSTWRLDVTRQDGVAVRHWEGTALAGDRATTLSVPWDGLDTQGFPLAPGTYTATLSAFPGSASELGDALAADQVTNAPARAGEAAVVQSWPIHVGKPPRSELLPFQPMEVASRSWVRAPASAVPPNGLPFTVYYGNLHSQTNHSDGGGDLATCTGAQNPQAGAYSPSDAYPYAYSKGLDVLMASEHNHMFDGSDSTNTSADPVVAHNRFQTGLQTAADFTAAHSDFLALYGMEWGVISNGGHMNIFGSTELFEWEYNASSQLIGDFYTPKSDYPSIYATLASKGLVGQFNHPATSGQFLVAGTALGYDANGDAVMVLAEVSNSSAFSVNTTETETSVSSYEGAWKKMLERGFHVAPATNQDNHCANWGASYTNRTAVLISSDTPLSQASYLEALQARRVFATQDKAAQLVLTAGDHLMGQRFDNDGSLTLNILYANSGAHTASTVQLYEGVPGRNGTVTLASSTASTTLAPTVGPHFYYAKITQDDGKLLWSAPVWVNQLDPSDVIFRDGFAIH